MKHERKGKGQLIHELGQLRQRIAELETSEARRKLAEDALRESKDKYRAILKLPESLQYLSMKIQPYPSQTRKFEELSGYSKGEVEGRKSWTGFVAQKDELERMKKYRNTLAL